MSDRPDEVYASRRAPAMRAESCNCNFQVIVDFPKIIAKIVTMKARRPAGVCLAFLLRRLV